MKKSILTAMVALTLTGTSALAAVHQGEWTGGGQAGVHVPSSDYKDLAKTGYVLGVFLDYNVTPMFSLGANLDFNSAKVNEDYLDAVQTVDPAVDDIKFTIFNYGVNGALAFMPEAVVHPYLKVGAGMYTLKTEITGTGASSDESTNKFGFLGGAGLMIHPAGNPVGFGFEGLIHNVTDAIEEFDGDTKSAQFFTVTGRISFSFSDASQK